MRRASTGWGSGRSRPWRRRPRHRVGRPPGSGPEPGRSSRGSGAVGTGPAGRVPPAPNTRSSRPPARPRQDRPARPPRRTASRCAVSITSGSGRSRPTARIRSASASRSASPSGPDMERFRARSAATRAAPSPLRSASARACALADIPPSKSPTWSKQSASRAITCARSARCSVPSAAIAFSHSDKICRSSSGWKVPSTTSAAAAAKSGRSRVSASAIASRHRARAPGTSAANGKRPGAVQAELAANGVVEVLVGDVQCVAEQPRALLERMLPHRLGAGPADMVARR